MVKFDYDNKEASELILEFKCEECFQLLETDSLEIPKMDFDNYTTIKHSFKHKCKCGVCYDIDIYNGLFDNYGIIYGLSGNEEDVLVHEVPFFAYNKDTIFVDTLYSFSRIKSTIEEIEGMGNDNKDFVYCLLFSNLITIIDSFVKIYTEPIILKENCFIEKFSSAFGIKKATIEEEKQAVKDFYDKKSFQSVCLQKKLFNDIFNVDVKIDERINRFVAIRDLIIHRNSIKPKGYIYKIKRSQLLEALNVIEEYIQYISSVLSEYEANCFVERTMCNENNELSFN